MQTQKQSTQNVVAGTCNIEGNTKTLPACLEMELGNQEMLKLAKEAEAQQIGFCGYNSRKRKAFGAGDLVTRV